MEKRTFQCHNQRGPYNRNCTQNGEKVIFATIYWPDGNPSLKLFRMINALSEQAIFLGNFMNSKHTQFGFVKSNKSGQTLVNIAKDLKLFYVPQLCPNRHRREDTVHGTPDILGMTFLSPGLSSRDISFSIADDHRSSYHFTIQVSTDKQLKRNTPFTETRYRSDKTDDDLYHNTLKDSLNSTDDDELQELAVILSEKLMKAVGTSTPETHSCNDPKSPISQAILDLIKEKRRFKRLYNTHKSLTSNQPLTGCRKNLGPQ